MRALSPRVVFSMRAGCAFFGLGLLLFLCGPFTPLEVLGSIPDLCLLRRTFGAECPGCGMGRSLASLCSLDLLGSLRYHPFGIVLVGFCVAGSFFPEGVARWGRPLALLSLLGILVFWLARMAGLA